MPPPPASVVWTPIYTFLFLCRIPFVISLSVFYFGIIEWLPVGGTIKYVLLWALLGLTGVWWVDFQVDGVKRGYVILLLAYIHGRVAGDSSEADRCTENSQKQKSTLPRPEPSSLPRLRRLSIHSTSPASSNPSSHARTQTAAR